MRCIGAVAGIASAAPVAAQRPLNLDFERSAVADAQKAWGWSHGWSPFASGPSATFTLDSVVRRGGNRSLRIALADSAAGNAPQTILLQLPSAFAAGRSVRLTGWIRVEQLKRRAFITLEAWGDNRVAAADTASLHAPLNADWTRHELAIQVAKDAHSVVVTLALDGTGTAWFDDFVLSVDGAPVTDLATGPEPSRSEVDWLAAHSMPLRSVTAPAAAARAQDSDLELFRQIVGDARIVALGESTHGTREFFLVKHRLLDYLVRRLGFTAFAIEANQIAVETINRYVHGADGTARDAMRVMFRVWNTDEMEQLVEWMRAYNAAKPASTLRFIGYDMQDHRRPIDTLRAFLDIAEPNLAIMLDTLLREYHAQRSWSTPQVPDSIRRSWRERAELLYRETSGRRSAWLGRSASRSDTLRVEWTVQAANLLRQAALGNETLNVPDRDSLMAANLDWVLRTLTPGARAVVWAHDIHVSAGGDTQLSFYNGATMGAQLRRLYGDAYRTFSLLTYEGSYSATKSLTDHAMITAAALPAPAGSLEKTLHLVPRPTASVGLTVDLRAARHDSDAGWLQRRHRVRHVGYAAYDFAFDLEAVFPLEFDGIVFIDRTSASRLVP
ncbi:MAG: erythromycin esterase family protein [Gemmatimonadaceae bacterium]